MLMWNSVSLFPCSWLLWAAAVTQPLFTCCAVRSRIQTEVFTATLIPGGRRYRDVMADMFSQVKENASIGGKTAPVCIGEWDKAMELPTVFRNIMSKIAELTPKSFLFFYHWMEMEKTEIRPNTTGRLQLHKPEHFRLHESSTSC